MSDKIMYFECIPGEKIGKLFLFCLCILMFLLGSCVVSCQRLIDRAESALECDEEVDIDLKFKVDFKDKEERTKDNDTL